jgi:hypothetical protein
MKKGVLVAHLAIQQALGNPGACYFLLDTYLETLKTTFYCDVDFIAGKRIYILHHVLRYP